MVVVYGIVARYGVDGLYMCTLMAGVLLGPETTADMSDSIAPSIATVIAGEIKGRNNPG